jgi:hypothetical protein
MMKKTKKKQHDNKQRRHAKVMPNKRSLMAAEEQVKEWKESRLGCP